MYPHDARRERLEGASDLTRDLLRIMGKSGNTDFKQYSQNILAPKEVLIAPESWAFFIRTWHADNGKSFWRQTV